MNTAQITLEQHVFLHVLLRVIIESGISILTQFLSCTSAQYADTYEVLRI